MKTIALIRARKALALICFLIISIGFEVSAQEKSTKQDENVKFEAGFYYTVKKGDTLWDISQKFNDSAWQWPDLWRENDQITNPHWIYPGERIRLFKKSDQLKTKPEESKAIVPQKPDVEVSAEIKPPPPSISESYFQFPAIDQVGFIRKPPVKPTGVIFKTMEDKKMISAGDIIYIRPASDDQKSGFIPGARFTVYRTLAPTPDSRSRKTIGTQHYLLGVVEITKATPEYAMAKVIKSFRDMQVNDLVMPYKPRSPKFAVRKGVPGLEGSIIAGEEHPLLMGDHSIAFIDKGEDDNVEAGQLYSVYFKPKKVKGDPTTFHPVDIGTLIVLHTEKTTSTVFITESNKAIRPGQGIRTTSDTDN